jgi:hypothetical protein
VQAFGALGALTIVEGHPELRKVFGSLFGCCVELEAHEVRAGREGVIQRHFGGFAFGSLVKSLGNVSEREVHMQPWRWKIFILMKIEEMEESRCYIPQTGKYFNVIALGCRLLYRGSSLSSPRDIVGPHGNGPQGGIHPNGTAAKLSAK